MSGGDHEVFPNTPPEAGSAKITLGLLPVFALSAVLTTPALAQETGRRTTEGDVRLDTITVQGDGDGSYEVQDLSSPKATAPILDTPQTVTVIPQAVIREQGATDLTEVLRNTPGISFNAGENGFATSTNNFQIRGFDASGDIFIDGARDSGSYQRDMFNVDRVEVIKGAASDNGRGGAGGYVNIVTKTPQLENFFDAEVSYGFDGYDSKARKRATADVNRIINDHIAIRLNAMVEDGGIAGREMAENNAWGVAPSVAFGLGTDFRVILQYEHVTRDDIPDWGVPGAMIKGTVNYDPIAAMAHRDNFYGLWSDRDDTTSDAVTGRVEYDITDWATISNQTRWSQVDRVARYTLPFGYNTATMLVDTRRQNYDRVNTSLTNLTNLTADFQTGRFSHRLSAGVDLTREESKANRYPTPGDQTTFTGIFFPNPYRPIFPPPLPTEHNDVTVDTIGVYAYDTMKLSEHWEITGGLRLDHYEVDISSKTIAGASTGNLDGFEDSVTTLGGRIGVVYKPVENGSLYGSIGVSSRPPGSYLSNPDISRTGDNAFPGFVEGADPVQMINYEIGVKWEFFDGDLLTTAALFRTEKRDVPIVGINPFIPGDRAGLKGYGEQIVQGLELGIAGNITEEWRVFGGVLFMDSERKHSPYLDLVLRTANPNDYDVWLTTSGDELAFTPNVTANLWTTYRFPIGLTIGGGFQYVGSSWVGRPDDANRIIPNGRYGKLPDYFVVNAMAAYEVTDNIDIRFNIDNIFDETYAVSMNWPATRAILGPPRTFRLSASFQF